MDTETNFYTYPNCFCFKFILLADDSNLTCNYTDMCVESIINPVNQNSEKTSKYSLDLSYSIFLQKKKYC